MRHRIYRHRAAICAAVAMAVVLWTDATRAAQPIAGVQHVCFTTVHAFTGADGGDGRFPAGGVVFGPDGSLYGVTVGGGVSDNGTIFRIDPTGRESVIHAFDFDDGYQPVGQLLLLGNGMLYGVASAGGHNAAGTIFRLKTDGHQFQTLHAFKWSDDAGGETSPSSGLVLASDGMLYGVASGGLALGVIYRQDPDCSGGCVGSYDVVHRFAVDGSEGGDPVAALIQANDGGLIGTTALGGAAGHGTIFRLGLGGDFTLLHSFTAAEGGDGFMHPFMPLVQYSPNAFYGVTATCAYEMDAAGRVTVLHQFPSGPNDGRSPDTGLTIGADGKLYATTQYGGHVGKQAAGSGTLFQMTKTGVETGLQAFAGPSTEISLFGGGYYPQMDRLVTGPDGWMYGVSNTGGLTSAGDYLGMGIVFKFRLPAEPP